MFRFKAVIMMVMLALTLGAAPAQAAGTVGVPLDISPLTSAITSVFGTITSGLNSLLGTLKQSSSAMMQGLKLQTDAMMKMTDLQNQTTNNAARQATYAQINMKVEPPPAMACQIAANVQSHYPRMVNKDRLIRFLAFQLSHLYIDPRSGKPVGIEKILRAMCTLGSTGKKAECPAQNASTNELIAAIEGGDWDITNTVIESPCIPMDLEKLQTELNNLSTQDTFKLADPNMLKAVAAYLSIRVHFMLSIDNIPTKSENDTPMGRGISYRVREEVSRLLAAADPILQALAMNSCFAVAKMPSCLTDDARFIDLLKAQSADGMPPNGYCISDNLKTDGKILFWAKAAPDLGKVAGGALETIAAANMIENNMDQAEARRTAIKSAAAHAAQLRPNLENFGLSDRPTGPANK